jgi:hypothetical protein
MTKKHEDVMQSLYNDLLDVTEEAANDGVTVPEMVHLLSGFTVQLAFDCAPCPSEAMKIINTAIYDRIDLEVAQEKCNEKPD